jgi:putative oxygen-independent coproporphyrinogen III oxidase
MINPILSANENEISIYIHWPFCSKKCPYCDFNSYTFSSIDHKKWLDSYLKNIYLSAKFYQGKKIKSIFFGGGTPSLMEANTTFELINFFNNHNIKNNHDKIKEITLEANPSTFEINKFKDFKNAGVNRLSIGVQSFFEENLKFLGRNHNAKESILALNESNKIFDNVSFDLIMGLPHQSFDNLKAEVAYALEFATSHLSLYQLTIEEGTAFYKNKVKTTTEENAYKFYDYIINSLNNKGILQYEISNFAKKGFESIHNINYWIGGQYVGIGPNAHGRLFYNNNWLATREFKIPNKWLEQVEKNEPLEESNTLSIKERFEEIIITALRLNRPLNKLLYDNLDKSKVAKLIDEKLITKTNDSIITTTEGRMCLNYLIYSLLT